LRDSRLWSTSSTNPTRPRLGFSSVARVYRLWSFQQMANRLSLYYSGLDQPGCSRRARLSHNINNLTLFFYFLCQVSLHKLMNKAGNQRLISNRFSCRESLNADHLTLRQADIDPAILLNGVSVAAFNWRRNALSGLRSSRALSS